MQNDFFTWGGGHFWEDVFFYQKWRIQRNYVTKKCRLLDNWDIRRHEGSFEECRQAFIKYIEVHEIARQRGHMIIMLPGLAESKNIFKPLWRGALKENFMAAAVNYPSTQKTIAAHVRQLDFFLTHLEDVEEISFVTKGVSSILLREVFSLNSPWQKRLKINRIVEVAPMNHGSWLLKKLSKNKFFNFVIGPMAAEMSPKNIERIPQLPKGIDCGIILSESIFTRLIETITRTRMPKITPESEKESSGAQEVIFIPNHKLNIFDNHKVVEKVLKFLTTGSF